MAQDTLLGFPAHTLPYRRGEFTHFIDSHTRRTQSVSAGDQIDRMKLSANGDHVL